MRKLYDIFIILQIVSTKTIRGNMVDVIEYVATYYKNELPSVCLNSVIGRYKLNHILVLRIQQY